jgi:hypothetical protein
LRRRITADECSVAEAPPSASAAEVAGARPDLAAAADPIPVLPQTARQADAIIFASCGVAFAALALWISREGHAVPTIDRHIHAWVLAHGLALVRRPKPTPLSGARPGPAEPSPQRAYALGG